jgi:hypothetical protein
MDCLTEIREPCQAISVEMVVRIVEPWYRAELNKKTFIALQLFDISFLNPKGCVLLFLSDKYFYWENTNLLKIQEDPMLS